VGEERLSCGRIENAAALPHACMPPHIVSSSRDAYFFVLLRNHLSLLIHSHGQSTIDSQEIHT
jgi:hypothetical protein